MPKRTRNALLCVGIVLSLLILWLRVESQFNTVSNTLVMFPEVLGYEDTKNYAVILLDPEKEPLLFLFTVSHGDIDFKLATSAGSVLKDLPMSDFGAATDVLTERILSFKNVGAVDAIGFVTSSAAGKVIDALGGVTMHDTHISSSNFSTIVWDVAHSEDAENKLSNSVSFPKANLILHSRSILFAAKDIFSKGLATVYFKKNSPFGKSCLGACSLHLFENLNSVARANQ